MDGRLADGGHVEHGAVELQRVSAVAAVDAGNGLAVVVGVAQQHGHVVGVDDEGVVTPAAIQHVCTACTDQGVVAVTGHDLVVAAGAGQAFCGAGANGVAVGRLEGHGVELVHTAVDHAADTTGLAVGIGAVVAGVDDEVGKAVAVDVACGAD